MDKLSNNMHKTIIDISSAHSCGELVAIAIKNNYITHYITDQNIAVKVSDILGYQDYITAVSTVTWDNSATLATPIGSIGIYTNGMDCGTIVDYEYTKDHRLNRIILDNCNVNALKIRTLGSNYIIFDKNNHVKRAKVEYSTQPVPFDTPRQSLATTVAAATAKPAVSDYSFLVGRTITRDIYSGADRAFCQGNTITDNIVAKARAINKLVELTLYSRKG